jgi:tRNA(Ile)-lysidine synthase
LISVDGAVLKINIELLLNEKARELLLHEWLHPMGFNPAQTEQIIQSLTRKTSGKLFYSDTHQALIDRRFIIVEGKQKEKLHTPNEFIIHKLNELKNSPVKVEFEKTKDKKIILGTDTAQIDFDKLTFPLVIRKWKQGDEFKPLGMSGFKKLSDFMINQKLSVFEKQKVWLFCSNNDIVWVMNYRMDERYKITPQTKTVLKLKIMK